MTVKSSRAIDPQAAPSRPRRRPENLALVYQELFTVVVRLRSNRKSVDNAESFRAKLIKRLEQAEQEAIKKGYMPDDVRLAYFAVVAFSDESILNSGNPVFADWARKPLQEEIFKMGAIAGEVFFKYLEGLLQRRDSSDLADVLEVYYLCLLLGYKGRYSSEPASLQGLKETTGQKIRQIRGPSQPLAPAWAPSSDSAPPRRVDPWIRRLVYATVACFVLALVLFVCFKLSLRSALADLLEASSR